MSLTLHVIPGREPRAYRHDGTDVVYATAAAVSEVLGAGVAEPFDFDEMAEEVSSRLEVEIVPRWESRPKNWDPAEHLPFVRTTEMPDGIEDGSAQAYVVVIPWYVNEALNAWAVGEARCPFGDEEGLARAIWGFGLAEVVRRRARREFPGVGCAYDSNIEPRPDPAEEREALRAQWEAIKAQDEREAAAKRDPDTSTEAEPPAERPAPEDRPALRKAGPWKLCDGPPVEREPGSVLPKPRARPLRSYAGGPGSWDADTHLPFVVHVEDNSGAEAFHVSIPQPFCDALRTWAENHGMSYEEAVSRAVWCCGLDRVEATLPSGPFDGTLDGFLHRKDEERVECSCGIQI